MTRDTAVLLFLTAAGFFLGLGHVEVAAFLGGAGFLVLAFGPTDEQRDARRRNR